MMDRLLQLINLHHVLLLNIYHRCHSCITNRHCQLHCFTNGYDYNDMLEKDRMIADQQNQIHQMEQQFISDLNRDLQKGEDQLREMDQIISELKRELEKEKGEVCAKVSSLREKEAELATCRDIYEAAVEGSVTTLENLLQQDALVLDRFLVGCHAETPLHIASLLGHAEFVREILSQKPDLAGVLDSRWSTPLHLAAAKGYLDIVKMLVSVKPETCFVRDRDGRNPLHIAAIKGHVSVLKELVQIRSNAARMILIDRGETILHLCVRYNQLQAMGLLMESMHDDGFLNSKDEDGNTLLHVAVAEKQPEAIKILATNTAIEVNALNAYGFTALDLSTQSRRDVKDWEIWELLRRFGAVNAKDIRSSAQQFRTTEIVKPHGDHPTRALQPQNKGSGNDQNDWLEKMRSALMVVASLIATVAFQAVVEGAWQESSSGDPNDPRPVAPSAGHSMYSDFRRRIHGRFLASNSIAFVASLSIILLLISGIPITRRIPIRLLMVIMWVAVTAMANTYLLSLMAVSVSRLSPDTDISPGTIVVQKMIVRNIIVIVWLGLAAFLILWHMISFTVKMVKLGRQRRQQRQGSFNMV